MIEAFFIYLFPYSIIPYLFFVVDPQQVVQAVKGE